MRVERLVGCFVDAGATTGRLIAWVLPSESGAFRRRCAHTRLRTPSPQGSRFRRALFRQKTAWSVAISATTSLLASEYNTVWRTRRPTRPLPRAAPPDAGKCSTGSSRQPVPARPHYARPPRSDRE